MSPATPETFRLFGFATGGYLCRCLTCKAEFTGDKRAITCLPCALTRAETAVRQDGSAEDDGAVMRHTLSVHETDKSDRAEGVAALQQAGEQIAENANCSKGWVLVPKEPTEAMICAGDGKDPGFGSLSAAIYRAMIAAAPQLAGEPESFHERLRRQVASKDYAGALETLRSPFSSAIRQQAGGGEEVLECSVAEASGEGTPPSPSEPPRSAGQRLCESFATTFEGGGWADAPEWENFDEHQHQRWERAAEHFLGLTDGGET